jgi:hypothetical protein
MHTPQVGDEKEEKYVYTCCITDMFLLFRKPQLFRTPFPEGLIQFLFLI